MKFWQVPNFFDKISSHLIDFSVVAVSDHERTSKTGTMAIIKNWDINSIFPSRGNNPAIARIRRLWQIVIIPLCGRNNYRALEIVFSYYTCTWCTTDLPPHSRYTSGITMIWRRKPIETSRVADCLRLVESQSWTQLRSNSFDVFLSRVSVLVSPIRLQFMSKQRKAAFLMIQLL